MKILLAESNALAAEAIGQILTEQGHHVHATTNGEDALARAKAYSHDIIVAEMLLPDMHGKNFIRDIRYFDQKTPILALTALAAIEDRVDFFYAGADGYLTKPFYRAELAARIIAIVRRCYGHADSTIECGRIALDLNEQRLYGDGLAIHLTPREYRLMEFFFLRKGVLMSREDCLDQLYGDSLEPESKIIDATMSAVRSKLRDICDITGFIECVPTMGWRLIEPKAKENRP